jgi:hypothetical protein
MTGVARAGCPSTTRPDERPPRPIRPSAASALPLRLVAHRHLGADRHRCCSRVSSRTPCDGLCALGGLIRSTLKCVTGSSRLVVLWSRWAGPARRVDLVQGLAVLYDRGAAAAGAVVRPLVSACVGGVPGARARRRVDRRAAAVLAHAGGHRADVAKRLTGCARLRPRTSPSPTSTPSPVSSSRRPPCPADEGSAMGRGDHHHPPRPQGQTLTRRPGSCRRRARPGA